MKTSKHPLAVWLEAAGMTAAELGREVGAPRSYITHILKGRRRPKELLLRLSERTGIAYDRLWRAA